MRQRLIWLPGVLLAAMAGLQPWFEANMARHMALELPALFAIGWLSARLAGGRFSAWLAPCNAWGLTGLTLASLVLAFWMVPAAIDLAVLSGPVGMAKVVSWVLAGAFAQASWKRAGVVIQAFFMLNGCWMAVAVGMMYRAAPDPLCSVYLASEQAAAGLGMMLWALGVLGCWAVPAVRSSCTV